MGRVSQSLICTLFASALGFAATAQGAVVAEFDAAAAGPGVDPTGVVPAWTKGGTAFTNDGTVLLQDTAQHFGEYDSPLVPGLMVENTTNYTVEFRVRPLTDVLGTEWFAQQKLTWRASSSRYDISIDKDADDGGPGTTGSLRYGQGTLGTKVEAVTGIDWSTPHTVAIAYTGATDDFEFFLDGVSVGTIASNTMTVGSNGPLDKIRFGDGTTDPVANGNQVEWYFVRLHDVAVPEPGSAVLLAGAGLLALTRRRGG